jgi:GAF domain-containing protein
VPVQGSQPTVHSAQIDVTLHGLVQAALEATGATYGAIGVLDDRGTGFERFLVVGMDAATRERIGRLPVGHGVLGLMLQRPEPLRLADLTTHPEAVGFPPGHPPMHSFLGAPVRVRGAVFGHLFLTVERVDAFTDADQAAAVGLAAAAGLAIGNAQLVEWAEHRRAWAQAGTDIATALLSGADPDTVLRSIGEQVAGLASADAAGVLVPSPDDEDSLTVVVAVGSDND